MKPKHHILISAVVLACLILLAYSKKTEITKTIRWSERLLSWEDFPVIDAIAGDYHAMVYSEIQFEGNREDQSLRIYAQMIPHKSGRVIKEKTETDQLLIHEQNHFNITEYHARLFRKEAITIGKDKLTNKDLQHLGKKYLAKIAIMQDRYDNESKHNTEWPEQRYWELNIAGLLRETAYYTNENLYSYQEFLGSSTPWYREVYTTLEGELLTSYPEMIKNSRYGEIYHVAKKQDSTIVKFYRNGKPTNGGYFEAALCIITFPNDTTRVVTLFDTENKPFSNDNEAHTTRTVKDTKVNYTRTYYDTTGKQTSREGVFTQKRIWNDSEKSMYSSYYNENGTAVMRHGAFNELRIMGANKVTNKISYFDSAGKPVRDKYFVSSYEYEIDDNLMITGVKKFDVDGKLVIALDGYSVKFEYDERGNVKSEAYFDTLGNKVADINGIHKYVYTFDLYGYCTDMRKFNVRELPAKGSDDFHQLVNVYDTLGRVTFSAKYYPDYVLMFTDNKSGASVYEFEGDSIIKVKNVDVYGTEEVNDLGIFLTKQFLNDKKEVLTEQYFDTKGTWAKTEDGVVSYTYKYDERGNQIEMTAFDSLGKPKAWQEDVATSRWEYDKNNNRIKTTYFTVENELANALQNTTYNGFKYDDNHNLLERTNYDKDMNPILFDGAFRINCILNHFGKDSIVTNYDVNNKITTAGIIKYYYNPQGILTSERVYNPNNQPALNALGVHKTVYNHDKFDRYLGFTYYGRNGERVNSIEGFSSMEIKLTLSGFVHNYAYYDNHKSPIIGPDGFHRIENFYNDMDEVVRTSTYGTNKKLLNNVEGIADYVYQIDKSGRTLRISFYDADTNLTEDSNGIAEYFYTPALNGLYYLEKQLNAKGEEVVEEAI